MDITVTKWERAKKNRDIASEVYRNHCYKMEKGKKE